MPQLFFLVLIILANRLNMYVSSLYSILCGHVWYYFWSCGFYLSHPLPSPMPNFNVVKIPERSEQWSEILTCHWSVFVHETEYTRTYKRANKFKILVFYHFWGDRSFITAVLMDRAGWIHIGGDTKLWGTRRYPLGNTHHHFLKFQLTRY